MVTPSRRFGDCLGDLSGVAISVFLFTKGSWSGANATLSSTPPPTGNVRIFFILRIWEFPDSSALVDGVRCLPNLRLTGGAMRESRRRWLIQIGEAVLGLL